MADSLKGSARSKGGKGVRRRVVGAAAIPGNWQNFLRVDTNKTELFQFLSQAIFTWFARMTSSWLSLMERQS